MRSVFVGNRVVGRGLILVTGALLLVGVNAPSAFAQAEHVRWDLVIFAPPTVSAGGTAAAAAQDNSTIAMTGSGTFVAPGGGPGSNASATGGGTWTTCNAAATVCTSGTYVVTGLVRWDLEPGKSLPPVITNDTIDDGTPAAGLVALRIAYSDGSNGTLEVSCNLPPGNPQMFEGITATKDVVDYWRHIVGGVTLFHIR
jgi:hypothetical protein